MKLSTRGFSGSQITNPGSKLNNSIQYGVPKCKKWLDSDGTRYSRVVEVADYKSEIDIYEFKVTESCQKYVFFFLNKINELAARLVLVVSSG